MKFQFLHKYRYETDHKDHNNPRDGESYLIPIYDKRRKKNDKLFVNDSYIEFIALHPTYRYTNLLFTNGERKLKGFYIYGAITHITVDDRDPIKVVRKDLDFPFKWNTYEKFYIRDYISKKSLTARDLAVLYGIRDCLQTMIMFNPYHSKITRID